MEQTSNLKKEEIEAEKKRLLDIRTMAVKTSERIKRLEEEHNEQRILHQKKLRNLRNTQTNQETRLTKLASDIKLLSNMTASYREELKNLTKINAERKAELKKTKDDTQAEVTALKNRIVQLEKDIKQGYEDLQNEKEMQVLMEVGLSNMKEDERLPLDTFEPILRKRQECVKQRQEAINKEISKIEEEQAGVEAEIKHKQNRLAALKETYSELVREYKKVKN